jgi:hypothetical protein
MCPNIKYIDEELEKKWSNEYYTMFCGPKRNTPKHELEADLRAVEISKQLLENSLKKISTTGGGFSDDLDKDMRYELESLMPVVHEIALLTLVYMLEYELIVHLDAVYGAEILKNEPYPVKNTSEFFSYYVKAGYNSAEYFNKSHIDPAMRALFLIDAMGIAKVRNKSDKKVIDAYDWRLAPFISGRLFRIRGERCGGTYGSFHVEIEKYVMGKFGY